MINFLKPSQLPVYGDEEKIKEFQRKSREDYLKEMRECHDKQLKEYEAYRAIHGAALDEERLRRQKEEADYRMSLGNNKKNARTLMNKRISRTKTGQTKKQRTPSMTDKGLTSSYQSETVTERVNSKGKQPSRQPNRARLSRDHQALIRVLPRQSITTLSEKEATNIPYPIPPSAMNDPNWRPSYVPPPPPTDDHNTNKTTTTIQQEQPKSTIVSNETEAEVEENIMAETQNTTIDEGEITTASTIAEFTPHEAKETLVTNPKTTKDSATAIILNQENQPEDAGKKTTNTKEFEVSETPTNQSEVVQIAKVSTEKLVTVNEDSIEEEVDHLNTNTSIQEELPPQIEDAEEEVKRVDDLEEAEIKVGTIGEHDNKPSKIFWEEDLDKLFPPKEGFTLTHLVPIGYLAEKGRWYVKCPLCPQNHAQIASSYHHSHLGLHSTGKDKESKRRPKNISNQNVNKERSRAKKEFYEANKYSFFGAEAEVESDWIRFLHPYAKYIDRSFAWFILDLNTILLKLYSGDEDPSNEDHKVLWEKTINEFYKSFYCKLPANFKDSFKLEGNQLFEELNKKSKKLKSSPNEYELAKTDIQSTYNWFKSENFLPYQEYQIELLRREEIYKTARIMKYKRDRGLLDDEEKQKEVELEEEDSEDEDWNSDDHMNDEQELRLKLRKPTAPKRSLPIRKAKLKKQIRDEDIESS